MSIVNLRAFLDALKKENDLKIISAPVDPKLEIPEIHRRVIEEKGPALLFTNIKGKAFPVVTNLFGTQKRIDLAFGPKPCATMKEVAALPHEMMPPSIAKIWNKRSLFKSLLSVGFSYPKKPAVLSCQMTPIDLTKLPALTSWEEDGGPFLTLPLVHTKSLVSGIENLGMYRIQIFSKDETGLHFQIHKGGGFHFHEAEQLGKPLPVNIYLGGPPALILSAIAPLPENVPELLLTSFVLGKKLARVKGSSNGINPIAEAEFCLIGEAPNHIRRPEGPFGDHYGYYSLTHDFPVFRPKQVFHRKDAIFPATIVGKPKQEDFYLGDYLQDLLSPLFPLVMPAVSDLWSYGETGYHALSAAVLKDRYGREAISSVFRILGEGQLSLTKFLIAIDKPMDLKDFKSVLSYALERVHWETDLYVINHLSMDTLDYASGQLNKGSKGFFIGMGEPKRILLKSFESSANLSSFIEKAQVFCPGCLVVSSASYEKDPALAEKIAQIHELRSWPMIVLVDDVAKTIKSSSHFLWTTFTRFNPASDIYFAEQKLRQHHIVYSGSLVIDARMKPWYPKELFVDPQTKNLVDKRWQDYFC